MFVSGINVMIWDCLCDACVWAFRRRVNARSGCGGVHVFQSRCTGT
jgi:hypothetical protein